MSPTCRSIRDRLGEAGAAALRDDPAAQKHLESCEDCFGLLEAASELERGLAALESHDVPEATVERLLAQVAAEPGDRQPAEPQREPPFLTFSMPTLPRGAGLLAASLGVAAILFLVATPSLMRARLSPSGPGLDAVAERQLENASPPTTTAPRSDRPGGGGADRKTEALSEEARERLQALGYVGPAEGFEDESGKQRALEAERKLADAAKARSEDRYDADAVAPPGVGREGGVPGGVIGGVVGGHASPPALEGDRTSGPDPASGASAGKDRDADLRGHDAPFRESPLDEARHGEAGLLRFRGAAAPEPVERVEPRFPPDAIAAGLALHVGVRLRVEADGRVSDVRATEASVRGSWGHGDQPLIGAVLDAVQRWRYAPLVVDGRAVPFLVGLSLDYELSPKLSVAPPPTGEAEAFVAERERTRGLRLLPARGYWANTWVPGDPLLRLLQRRLEAPSQSGPADPALALHAASRPPRRPFDPPQGAALGLFVQSDRAALEGEQRLLVEVGLQATRHAGGRRPALELALVLDLRAALAVEEAASLRAVALAFARAHRSGDRFRLIAAGRGAVVADVAPEDFRYGSLALALEGLLAEATAGPGDPGALPAALARAIAETAEPAAGAAAAVVLVTAGSLQPLPPLARLAHRGAVTAAVTTSVVGVGARVVPDELDQLALAGQGYRRLLERREEAEALAERQLASAGRAVARALRLRIRLAPGVRLVQVVGSRRLDAQQADRVREAEHSLDQRLARELGLEADRGEDEDGIQIVIPSFEAGATHSILLDVVAPGPGPIADVSLRYKDVAFLRNGTARTSLQLPRGQRVPGPLERSVVSLLLARRLEADLEAAGDAVARGDVSGASRRLQAAVELRAGLPALWPAFAGDPELQADVAMLSRYAAALPAAGAPEQRRRLSDSLRYAALLKRLPRPAALVADVP